MRNQIITMIVTKNDYRADIDAKTIGHQGRFKTNFQFIDAVARDGSIWLKQLVQDAMINLELWELEELSSFDHKFDRGHLWPMLVCMRTRKKSGASVEQTDHRKEKQRANLLQG